MRRAKEGDVDAYAVLLRAHEAAARRLAAVVSGTGDADEVAQDAFVKAWGGLDSFRPSSPFRPWLLRIVANEARNRRRAAGRRAGYELRFATDRAVAVAGASPESAVLAAATQQTLRAALASLPGRERDVRDLPLRRRAERGGDRAGARGPPRHREVARVPWPRSTAGRHGSAAPGGAGWLSRTAT